MSPIGKARAETRNAADDVLAAVFEWIAFFVDDLLDSQKERVVRTFRSKVIDRNIAMNAVEASDEGKRETFIDIG
ncbi:MAG TPA: hypothetical protein VJT08_11375 [Terriglobales bacterium]|nr:hypothetical protein [Terriglobales bacterium]